MKGEVLSRSGVAQAWCLLKEDVFIWSRDDKARCSMEIEMLS